MNFVADESVDQAIVQRLRHEGHQVWYVAEMEPGVSDDTVLNLANREAALLLTADKDFGEMVFRQRRFSGGIVLTRLAGLSAERKQDVVALTVRQHASELPHSFTVITPGLCRLRPLPRHDS
jgi:predicted nuclease of predicted toxin-antitoxin system